MEADFWVSSLVAADSLLLPLRGGDCVPPWNLSRLGVCVDHGVLSTWYHVPHAGVLLRQGGGLSAPALEAGQRGGWHSGLSRGGPREGGKPGESSEEPVEESCVKKEGGLTCTECSPEGEDRQVSSRFCNRDTGVTLMRACYWKACMEAGLEWLDQRMGAKDLERTATGNFLESLSAKGSRDMGHWLGVEGSREGFVQIRRIQNWVSMLMTMTCRRGETDDMERSGYPGAKSFKGGGCAQST